MGKIIREGVKAIARKELESIFVEEVLEKYSDINQLIDKHIKRIVEKCSQCSSEDMAYKRLEEALKKAQKDVARAINDIL